MNVQLDNKHELRIEAIAKSTGRTVDEVVYETIERGLSTLPNGSPLDGNVQRVALEVFLRELDKLPVKNPDDAFGASDHDRWIYNHGE